MQPVTLEQALGLPNFRRAAPEVIAGAAGLGRPIRWVHASEELDIGDLLRPGDLLLTMGTGLPADSDDVSMRTFVEDLIGVGAVGLVIESGRRWGGELPSSLVGACEDLDLPLILLRHETRFAALAQEIGERVVDEQLAELRDAQRVHETFTELSFGQAGPAEILNAVQRLAGTPVVVENSQHRPLDYVAGSEDMGGFLDGWVSRSQRVVITGRTGWDETNGWLLTRLGTMDQAWGRLVIAAPTPPPQRLIAVAERAAAALSLHRLHDRDRDNVMRRTHQELVRGLQTAPESADVVRRCELAGYPTHRRRFVGLLVRPRMGGGVQLDADLAAAVVRAAHAARVPALVHEADRDVRALLSVAPANDADALADRIAGRLLQQYDVVIAAGRAVDDRAGIARTLTEAGQVADAVPMDRARRGAEARPVHRLEDLHLRGLLALFGADERLTLFVDRELAPLKQHDRADGSRTELLAALRALLLNPASKTDAAASLHLSRAAFYDRLAKIETMLGADLDDPDVRVSLHVALVADELFSTSTN